MGTGVTPDIERNHASKAWQPQPLLTHSVTQIVIIVNPACKCNQWIDARKTGPLANWHMGKLLVVPCNQSMCPLTSRFLADERLRRIRRRVFHRARQAFRNTNQPGYFIRLLILYRVGDVSLMARQSAPECILSFPLRSEPCLWNL